ncbi:MAG: hypothetical protein ACRDHL_06365 [Candidatus Promineifilaceae bacterium]
MKKFAVLALVVLLLAVSALPALAAPKEFGQLYHDDDIVRTFGVPASLPHGGIDPLFTFPDGGAEGQLAITAVAPGDPGYHGGSWAVYAVTWNVTPYLLTSDEALDAAAAAGDVTISRVPEADFRCPVLP